MAGGQSLVAMMNNRIVQPAVLISINHCPELDYTRLTPTAFVVGAGARQAAVGRAQFTKEHCPLLAVTLPQVGTAATRNRGTVCGSLAHADPLAELPAVALALDAVFMLSGPAGRREVQAEDFFVAELTTSIEPGEMVEEVCFARTAPGAGVAFVESGNRKHGFALAGVAVQLEVDGLVCRSARIAIAGYGARAMRLRACEEMLAGTELSESQVRAVGQVASSLVEARDDFHADAAYRRALAGTLVVRAINKAFANTNPVRLGA
jgi:carbon-monoxide dehydrogenase medium subunit